MADGTGKTEFAKFLAAKADHKLRVKMGSDLLSMWVGGTEHNIANAFKDAEDDWAILSLDEIDGAPGDMAVVRQNLFYLGGSVTNADRIAALEQEVECKRNYHPRTIGFGRRSEVI